MISSRQPENRRNDAKTGQFCYVAAMMAELPDNPFTPGIGELPPVMGRRPEIETWLLQMLDQLRKGKPARAKFAFLYGPRGNGKTVLLRWLLDRARQAPSVIPRRLTPEDLESGEALAAALGDLAGWKTLAGNLFNRLNLRISASGAEFGFDTGQSATGPASHTIMGRADRPVLLLLDEAHTVPPEVLRRLLGAVQDAGFDTSVALVLAGTPGLEDVMRDSAASFWDRGEECPVGRLSAGEAERVIAEPFRQAGVMVEDGAAAGLAAAGNRFPYFLQVYGAAAWDAVAGTGSRRLGQEQVTAAATAGNNRRERYYQHRYEEFSDTNTLALARAVALAFQAHAGQLNDAQLNAVLDHAAGDDPGIPGARRLLRARGYIWRQPQAAHWEPGIPSLMDYMIATTAPVATPLPSPG